MMVRFSYTLDKIEEENSVKFWFYFNVWFSIKVKKVDMKTLDYYELRCQLVIFSLDVVVQY